MNEILDVLATRRSAPPPMLGAPGPSAEQLDRLLTIASRVPDHGKLAPWRFILFAGEGRAKAGEVIADVFAAAHPEAEPKRLEIERRRFSAPLVIGVVSRAAPHAKIPEWEQGLSAGAVCMNGPVPATAMGFATTWLTEWYAYDRAVLERLGVEPYEKIAGFIHVGTSPEPREDRVRPALADLVTSFGR